MLDTTIPITTTAHTHILLITDEIQGALGGLTSGDGI
ncbi:MAG: hypothetical protein JWO56_2242, partial [Acidobacteria bacterium]|nr:hypothetical protein [Acidobacteriota bacterium]